MAIAPRRCPPKQCHYPLWTMPFSSQTMRINLRPNNALGQCVRPGKQGPTLAGGNLGEGLAPANLNGQHLNYPQLTSAASPQPYTPTQTLSSAFSSSTNHNQGNHFRISIFWRDKSRSSCCHCCCCSFELWQTLVPFLPPASQMPPPPLNFEEILNYSTRRLYADIPSPSPRFGEGVFFKMELNLIWQPA